MGMRVAVMTWRARADALLGREFTIGARAATVLVSASFVFLCLPRISGWTLSHVHKEDGVIFLHDWVEHGWGSVFELYTDYLHVVPRLTKAFAASLPPEAFAPVIGVLAAGWRIWLATVSYWAFRSLDWSPKSSAVAASMFVLVPAGQHEVLGNLTNERWFCDAGLVVIALSRLTGLRAALASVTGLLCALSDPLAIALIPVLAMGVWLNRGRGWLAPLTAITGALIHAAMLDSGARQAGVSAWLHLPGELLGQFVVRGLEIPQFGVTGTMVANKLAPWPVVALGVLLPIAILLKCRDRRLLLMLATAWYLLACSIVFASPQDLTVSNWFAAGQPSRYSLVPSILLAMVAVGVGRLLWGRGQKTLPILVACAFLVGMILDFRGDPQNAEGPTWANTVERAQTQCRATPLVVTPVEFNPTRHPQKWEAPIRCAWLMR